MVMLFSAYHQTSVPLSFRRDHKRTTVIRNMLSLFTLDVVGALKLDMGRRQLVLFHVTFLRFQLLVVHVLERHISSLPQLDC